MIFQNIYVVVAENSSAANESWNTPEDVYRLVCAYHDVDAANEHADNANRRIREIEDERKYDRFPRMTDDDFRKKYPNDYDLEYDTTLLEEYIVVSVPLTVA